MKSNTDARRLHYPQQWGSIVASNQVTFQWPFIAKALPLKSNQWTFLVYDKERKLRAPEVVFCHIYRECSLVAWQCHVFIEKLGACYGECREKLQGLLQPRLSVLPQRRCSNSTIAQISAKSHGTQCKENTITVVELRSPPWWEFVGPERFIRAFLTWPWTWAGDWLARYSREESTPAFSLIKYLPFCDLLYIL